MIIRLQVFEQTLSIIDTRAIPRKGSKDYLVLQFMFSSDWKDLDKICYLQRGEVSQPIDVVDGLVDVPEWFTQQDSFDVTLFGKSGSQEVPTNVVSLRLEKSNTLWEQDAPEPQPGWIGQLIALNQHPPIPGENGYWMIWDTDSGAYVESELPLPDISVGPQGPQGEQGPAGPQGPKGEQGPVGPTGEKGETGAAFTYDMFTPEQLAALKGPQGDKGDKGNPGEQGPAGADGKNGAGMDITGATVGQIAKITAVDENGTPTAREPVDMPSGGGMRWQKIKEITLTEQTNRIVISEDDNGVSVADYNPIAMKVDFSVPADSTQTSNSGSPWIYPSATKLDSDFRAIGSIAAWKTTQRRQIEFFIGDINGIFAGGNVNAQLVIDPSRRPEFTVMDGVTLYINNTGDHWPVGTIVSLEVLSERA